MMKMIVAPETDRPDTQPTEIRPQRSGGWFTRLKRKVRLAFAGDDDELRVENATTIAWRVYHDYHQLGILDPHEERAFRLTKHGSLHVRPYLDEEPVDYLVLPLSLRVHHIRIYRRRVSKEIEVYDLKAA
jgi:hypothetical protein